MKLASVIVIGMLSVAVPGCTSQATGTTQSTPSPSSVAVASPTVAPTSGLAASPSATPTSSPSASRLCPPANEADFDANQVVLATANIFGAGRDLAPMPGGGGGGTLPPAWELPDGLKRIVSIACAEGQVNPIKTNPALNGPEGRGVGRTDIESLGGISGIVDENNGMFLVGVFLMDTEPSDSAPKRLDFSDAEDFDVLAPQIGQTFFVGDGSGRRFRVPTDATRLFLGFADGHNYVGLPGWYGNNAGQLEVTLEIAIE
jgi:hypothetical protein